MTNPYLEAARTLLADSRFYHWHKGRRAVWVADRLVEAFPELGPYRIRLYDWALHSLASFAEIPFPVGGRP